MLYQIVWPLVVPTRFLFSHYFPKRRWKLQWANFFLFSGKYGSVRGYSSFVGAGVSVGIFFVENLLKHPGNDVLLDSGFEGDLRAGQGPVGGRSHEELAAQVGDLLKAKIAPL